MCTQQIWEGYGPLAGLVLLSTSHNGSDLDFDELNSKGAPADLDGKKLHLKKSPLYTWRLCSWSRGLEWKADKTEGPKRNRPDPKLKESGINITWQYGKREPTCLLENTVPVCPVLQQSPFCDGWCISRYQTATSDPLLLEKNVFSPQFKIIWDTEQGMSGSFPTTFFWTRYPREIFFYGSIACLSYCPPVIFPQEACRQLVFVANPKQLSIFHSLKDRKK